MCVIAIKPANVQMLDIDTLRQMAHRNPNGFGFATTSGQCYKSTDFKAFLSRLEQIPDSEGVVIHMRLATHGSVKKNNCHPFYDEETDTYFAHNGVLPIPSVHDMTDSEIAFRDILVPAIKKYGIQSKEFDEISDSIRGHSKFAYIHKGDIYIQGNFSEIDGYYFSNTYWQWF